MSISKSLLIAVLFFSTTCKAQCNLVNDEKISNPIKISESLYVVFGKAQLPEEGPSEENYQITLSTYNCITKKLIEFDRLHYLANPGRIAGATFINNPSKSEEFLFIIQATEISNTAAGVNYSSDYYSVRAYRKHNLEFKLENAQTNFFGAGGDIYNEKENTTTYHFPYKNIATIKKIITTRDYFDLVSGKTIKKEILQKTYLHSEPLESKSTNKYLVEGDLVELSDQTSGWCLAGYKNPRRGLIQGWINCQDIKNLFNN